MASLSVFICHAASIGCSVRAFGLDFVESTSIVACGARNGMGPRCQFCECEKRRFAMVERRSTSLGLECLVGRTGRIIFDLNSKYKPLVWFDEWNELVHITSSLINNPSIRTGLVELHILIFFSFSS